MVYVEPEVVNPPKEQSVPQFNKKEIIAIIKEAQEAGILPSGGSSGGGGQVEPFVVNVGDFDFTNYLSEEYGYKVLNPDLVDAIKQGRQLRFSDEFFEAFRTAITNSAPRPQINLFNASVQGDTVYYILLDYLIEDAATIVLKLGFEPNPDDDNNLYLILNYTNQFTYYD